MARYKLKKGRFEFYFYDSKVKIDLTLEMLLNRLNKYHREINKKIKCNISLKKNINQLEKGKPILSKEICKANIEGNCSFKCSPCVYENILVVNKEGKTLTFRQIWNKSNPK